jgi:hypothetical protein
MLWTTEQRAHAHLKGTNDKRWLGEQLLLLPLNNSEQDSAETPENAQLNYY